MRLSQHPLDPSRSPRARWARLSLGVGLGVGLFAAAFATPLAQAATPVAQKQDIHLSYDVTTPYAITNILTYNTYADGGSGVWWPATLPEGGGALVDGFTKSSDNAPLTTLILGLTTGLPNDATGQTHVVLMMDSAAATAAKNIAWGTLFRNTNEDQLAARIALVTGTTRAADGTADAATWDAAFEGIDQFAYGNARDGILVPPGESKSAWFAMGNVMPGANSTSAFTVMAFSDGQQIGTGVANLASVTAVPEPQTWALMLAGLGVAGFMARRRRN